MARSIALLLIATTLAGCISESAHSTDAARSATAVDPATATPLYWLDQPATAKVTAEHYDRLWAACDAAARHYRFVPDVLNYRQGVMTSQALISKGVGEFWRNDVQGRDDLQKSTLASYRRTIRYEIARTADDHWEVSIKVLVERSSAFERRVTTAVQYRDVFAKHPAGAEFRSDDGAEQPAQYWYATGRDQAMEQALADTVREKLRS